MSAVGGMKSPLRPIEDIATMKAVIQRNRAIKRGNIPIGYATSNAGPASSTPLVAHLEEGRGQHSAVHALRVETTR